MRRRQFGGVQQKLNLLLEELKKRFFQAYYSGKYEEALRIALQAHRMVPRLAQPLEDACICCVHLERWDASIKYGEQCAGLGGAGKALYDGLSHAYGAIKNWPKAAYWGLQALDSRVREFNQAPIIAHENSGSLPPPPQESTRSRNILAFSLYGAKPKYCEPAILNAALCQQIYPAWTCCFYVDETVPSFVKEKLLAYGARLIEADAWMKQALPGPMWRLLAYDLPDVDRVLFRDADSVISTREADAVLQWLESGRSFHMMRDAATHTELILAGLWGVQGLALPKMRELLELFLRKPLQSRHFADQYFLREMVWPYAKQSLLQHDSLFGFMSALPFPDGATPEGWHVGYAEGSPTFTSAVGLPDNTPIQWTLHEKQADGSAATVCSYPGIVKNGCFSDNLPRRYILKIETGQMYISARTLG